VEKSSPKFLRYLRNFRKTAQRKLSHNLVTLIPAYKVRVFKLKSLTGYLRLELVVLFDGARFGDGHAASDVVLLDAAEEDAHLISGAGLIQRLVEHLDA
jgi:hypothetical protein